ncbi:hypothetical protein L7F22_047438 [Adiantum nelumboides]|nr:hypothetical protein [Adiantum nelumboides]
MLLQQGTNSHYMKPIYCASRVKLKAERDYTDVELIMVNVVYACRIFRHYLLPKLFTFLTSYTLLPRLVNSPTLSKRLMKFIVELQEFQFSFLVEESTRSTLADLLTYKEAPLLIKENTLKKEHMEAPDIDNAYLLFLDGSYRKSHNEASGGVVIYDPQGNLVTKRGLKLTSQSNNEAEYATLEKELQLCLELGIQHVKVKGDALLVVKQVLEVWQRRESLEKEERFLQTSLLPAELEKSKKYAFFRRAKRWNEAKPVKQITSKDVATFVYEDICCKFGMPLELLSDKGLGFRGELVNYLCEKLHVRRRFTTPYYPQCNGMNERFNGELIRMLTKMTQSNVKTWDLELPCALWLTEPLSSQVQVFLLSTLFLAEALLPIEVEIPALEMIMKFEEENHDSLKERLLYLQCLQLDRALALEHYEQVLKTSQAKANAKVKDKGIKKSDMVLRYNSKLDSTFQKKFQIKWQGPFLVLDRFPNGTYQLVDLNGTPHKARVNGYRLKKYYARLMVVIEDEPSFEESADMVADHEEKMKTSSFGLHALFAATADHE